MKNKKRMVNTIPILFSLTMITIGCTRILNDFLVSTITDHRLDAANHMYFLDENEKLVPLNKAGQTIQEIPHDQVTFFIHGMGPYPEKGTKFAEFSSLKANFARPVYGIMWPSFIDFVTIPRGDALHT